MKHEEYTKKLLSMFNHFKTNSLKGVMLRANMKSIIADSDQIIEVIEES